jgi:feruloyl esterase
MAAPVSGSLHLVALAVMATLLLAPNALAADPSRCEALSKGTVPSAKVTLAEVVPAGDWKDPQGGTRRSLPAFCRVALDLSTGTGSAIRAEVWLPLEGWNGRLLGTGTGSYGGQVDYGQLEETITRGFAGVSDDMGTAPAKGMDGAPLVGQPVKWLDFGHRAAHAAAVVAKQVSAAFYGRPAHHAYFMGCSTGGQQALSEAQRYPEDYDGVVAGCGAWDRIGVHASVVWMHRVLRAEQDALPTAETISLLHKATLAACGPRDGPAAAEYLLDPSRCAFDPGRLECKEAKGPACIPAAQVRALRALHAGPRNPRTGAVIYPGLPRGAESARYFAFVAGQPTPPWDGLFRWVFGAGWDPATFDFDRDLATVRSVLGEMLDAASADLGAFEKRGGKLLLWHGWADPINSAGNTISYYQRLVAERGGRDRDPLAAVRRFARLFLVPGVKHCWDGPGPDAFGAALRAPSYDSEHDAIAALVRWVEQGVPPDRIVATKFKDPEAATGIVFQRPLCPWPEVAAPRPGADASRADRWACGPAPGASAVPGR